MKTNSDLTLKYEKDRSKIKKIIEKKVSEIRGYTPKVGVFGVTGVGKSSLCNALFGKDLAKVSDVAACTRTTQEITIRSSDDSANGITLIDVPGVGETIERDGEYFDLYKNLSPTLDLVIWVIKADDRAYSVAEKAYKDILEKNLKACPVLFVINQVDKVEPIFNDDLIPYWNKESNTPKPEKEVNIQKKVDEISKAFNISTTYIQTTSVSLKYNIVETMEKIIEILPNEKKYSVYREANENIKTEKMEETAERGMWESVKEWAGEAWETTKEIVAEIAIETVKNAGKSVVNFISKFKFW